MSIILLHGNLVDSCRLRGIPSKPLYPSSSICFESRIGDDVDKPIQFEIRTPDSQVKRRTNSVDKKLCLTKNDITMPAMFQ